MVPVVGLILAACGYEDPANNTGDKSDPSLFGETANGIGFPHEVVTTEGIAAAGLYLPIFIIAVIVFVFVEGWLLLAILRFRKRSTGTDLPAQTHGNNKAEIIWTAIPLITVFALFVVATGVLLDIEDQSEEHAAVVDVSAFRFGWKFDYMDPTSLDTDTGKYDPQGVLVAGGGREGAPEMVLPVDRPVLIRLTAEDVIHSWYVPSFFFKRDAIPGRTSEFELTIEEPGIYGGQCAEFCGLAHGDMFFSVNAVAPEKYDDWIANGGSFPEADTGETDAGDPEADLETTDETSEEAA